MQNIEQFLSNSDFHNTQVLNFLKEVWKRKFVILGYWTGDLWIPENEQPYLADLEENERNNRNLRNKIWPEIEGDYAFSVSGEVFLVFLRQNHLLISDSLFDESEKDFTVILLKFFRSLGVKVYDIHS